jgi:NADPH2 dehydrogenase
MKLFESLQISQLELKNRVVMAPMCMYSADKQGIVQPFHLVHYPARAYGGVGLIIVEATGVEPRGRITENDLGIWSDDHIPGLKKLVEAVHLAGAKIGIQLAHAGRKAMVSEPIVAPSALAFSPSYQTPNALSVSEIKGIVEAFRQAAIRAELAGFDCVEIHGAHGYLTNQFMSPLANQRTDAYGGSPANRRRFLEEVLTAVRSVWAKPLLLRLSAEEYAEGGNHLADTLETLSALPVKPDVVHVSSGGVVSVKFDVFPGYQIAFADAVKKLGFVTIGGGLITTPEHVEQILSEGKADLVFLARELLRNPNFVLKAAVLANRKDLVWKAYERGF